MQHIHHIRSPQRCYTTLPLPILTVRKSEEVVLRYKGEEYYVGTLLHKLSAKFFPMGKTNALRGKITSFQQQHDESVPEAWERFQDYILECPNHGMESWLLM